MKEFVCEDCGREYIGKIPFPESCPCGNVSEDFYREKDAHDYKDDEAKRPLFGVKYDPIVSKERMERLK